MRLRVLIPAVENAISGNAFRPGDVLPSRKGLTVEIGNTDAEGRLILADALALADEEEPRAADRHGDADRRGARGARAGPAALLHRRRRAGRARSRPPRSPSTTRCGACRCGGPTKRSSSSKIADINNVTTDGFAGSITAALFLRRFVEKAASWAHFDIFAWNPSDRAHGPAGGEAQGIRALERVLSRRYG